MLAYSVVYLSTTPDFVARRKRGDKLSRNHCDIFTAFGRTQYRTYAGLRGSCRFEYTCSFETSAYFQYYPYNISPIYPFCRQLRLSLLSFNPTWCSEDECNKGLLSTWQQETWLHVHATSLSPRPVRQFPRQASQLKSSGRYVILAVMPSVENVSPNEGTSPRLYFVIAPKLSVLHRDLYHATNFLKICQKYVRTIEKLYINIFKFQELHRAVLYRWGSGR